MLNQLTILLLCCAILTLTGCSGSTVLSSAQPTAGVPIAMSPVNGRPSAVTPGPALPPDDLTEPGAVAWGHTEPSIIDTRIFSPQIQLPDPSDKQRAVKEILPAHTRPGPPPVGEPNDLEVMGGVLTENRITPGMQFPGIGATGWTPPDPTIAVGPDHIVATVNMDIAFYTKDGTSTFQVNLGSPGNPGFFEPVGAGDFTFDPKCFYDHIAQRFVVLALETYGTTESWITFAVSDDNDPHGTWYKYRTHAVIQVGNTTYWWDYPGFGYDDDAYYITGNLFGLNSGGWAGVGFRAVDKASVINGGTASYATLRDGDAASVQAVQHFGVNTAPFFVSVNNSTSLRIHAITNPTTNPNLVSTTVSVPSHSGPFSAPAAGGYTISTIDARIMNAHWRYGKLYATHHISAAGKVVARWYEMDTGNWPNSGSISLTQSGNVDGGGDKHAYFPAIYSNATGEVGLVIGTSSASDRIAVSVTGRRPSDDPGTMGAVQDLHIAPVNGGGRWGDYYDIAIDPNDDDTFWVVGEFPASGGWSNWIESFNVDSDCSGDITGNGIVNIDDIFAVLGLWGSCPDPCPPYCTGDLTQDCMVNIDDVFAILGMWGPCP